MRAGEGKENENKAMRRKGHLDAALSLCSAGQLASEQTHDTRGGAFPPSGHASPPVTILPDPDICVCIPRTGPTGTLGCAGSGAQLRLG